MYPKISWPDNKRFAFTIFDDTDRANLRDNQLVYRYLQELNFKTTKSVWICEGNKLNENDNNGITCDNEIYFKWLLELKSKGFEIGYHNTTYSSSYRKKIEEGLCRIDDYLNKKR